MHVLDLIPAFRKLPDAVKGSLRGRKSSPSVLPHFPTSAELLSQHSELVQLLGCKNLPKFEFAPKTETRNLGLGTLEFFQPGGHVNFVQGVGVYRHVQPTVSLSQPAGRLFH